MCIRDRRSTIKDRRSKLNSQVLSGTSQNSLEYLTAEEEEDKIIAQGNAPLDDQGKFVREKVKARSDADYPVVTPDQVELMLSLIHI